MSITIAYYPEMPETGPHYLLALPPAAVDLIVATAMATKGHRGIAVLDQYQGNYASEVTADILSAAAKKMDVPTALLLAPYIWHVRKHRFSVTVEHTTGTAAKAWRVCTLTVNSTVVDAPEANWCAGNAYFVLETIGYDPDALQVAQQGGQFPAPELAARCQAALAHRWERFGEDLGRRIERVLEIATYAMRVGGPQAVVTVA